MHNCLEALLCVVVGVFLSLCVHELCTSWFAFPTVFCLYSWSASTGWQQRIQPLLWLSKGLRAWNSPRMQGITLQSRITLFVRSIACATVLIPSWCLYTEQSGPFSEIQSLNENVHCTATWQATSLPFIFSSISKTYVVCFTCIM